MSHSPQPTVQNVREAKNFVGIPGSGTLFDTNFQATNISSSM